jgi:hypothetical protein
MREREKNIKNEGGREKYIKYEGRERERTEKMRKREDRKND